jgi:chemotaxis protein methyltransferase CheR
MNPLHYEYLSTFLLGSSGLALGDGKEYLLESRLVPLAQSWGLDGIPEMVAVLRKGDDHRLSSAVTEAMTTNETSFFRDKKPFTALETEVLPKLLDSRRAGRSLRIWCAAAATGQEPYSLAMMLDEKFPELDSWNVEILATDISEQILEKARAGIYTQFEVQRGLPVQLLMRYFKQVENGWKVKDNLGRRIQWQQTNLLDSFDSFGPFDIVLCRNVLIYFQNETKADILDRIRKVIRPDGFLFMGAAETVLGITESFERLQSSRSSIYVPGVKVLV